MSNRNDFDYMKEKFDADKLQAPEGLSTQEIRRRLSAEADGQGGADRQGSADLSENDADRFAGAGPKKKSRAYVWRSLTGVAACVVAVLLVSNLVIGPIMKNSQPDSAGLLGQAADDRETAAGEGKEEAGANDREAASAPAAGSEMTDPDTGIVTFADYDALEKRVAKMVPEKEDSQDQEFGTFRKYVSNGLQSYATIQEVTGAMEDTAGADMEAASSSDAAGGASSDTYVQVQGVDEADVVKTDDHYIYYLDSYWEDIRIVRADQGKTTEVGKISSGEKDPLIDDFYLYDDTLVTIGTSWDDSSQREYTAATIYDISDRTKPKKVNTYKQSGYLVSSRMVGQYLYLITNYSFYLYGDGQYIPYVSRGDSFGKMEISDICAFPHVDEPQYVIAGSLDVTSGENMKTKAKAVLGGSEDIYCNTENLYIAGYHYGENYYIDGLDEADDILEDGTEISDGDVTGEEDSDLTDKTGTRLLKASFQDGSIRFVAGGMVKGYVNNQFSMDEKDGYLRIATTSQTAHGYDINNLFVLDEKLHQVGAITDFAKDEHIEAVRYIGGRAYVITYEQTDPLFIIDLSDPKHPKMEGSVKIDGFSTLLVPNDENTLLGIGYATATTKYGEVQEGLKFVAFDISDPAKPKVADEKEFLNASSQVQENHKALIRNEAKDYYALPYNQYDDEDYYFDHGGVLVVRVKNGKVKFLKDYQEKDAEMRRCVYIGDYIYTIDQDDAVKSFLMK